MKYKVGDKVKVRSDLVVIRDMAEFLGHTVTINSSYNSYGQKYKIKEDGEIYNWTEEMFEGLATPTLTITIDPTNPSSAHKAVTEAINDYNTKSRDWTEDEIEQAKTLSRELIVKLFEAGMGAVWYIGGTFIMGVTNFGDRKYHKPLSKFTTYRAEPTPNDIFNVDIGKCVCLCKLTNTPIPDFILKNNKRG